METTPIRPFQVARDGDRHAAHRKVGIGTLFFKVTTADSNGAFLVAEIAHHAKGGPPRHLHRDQDEWFQVSRRGNRYLRVLFVQAAWVVLIKPKIWERHGLKPWIEAARKRLHHNVLASEFARRLERPGPWPGLRGADDGSGREPIRLIPIPRQRQQRPKNEEPAMT